MNVSGWATHGASILRRLFAVGSLAVILALLAALPAAADEVLLLHTPREAAEERVRLILDAREEINAEYFIIGHDPFSLTALTLLRDAARRGLTVRLIVDAQWNKIPRPVQAHVIDEGVQIRVYHPFRLCKPLWITRRMHDKLLVVDGEAMVAGGRNIESPYFGLGRQLGRRDYIDLDILVRGDSAARARGYFMELWESREVRPAGSSASARKRESAERLLDRQESWLDERIEEVRATPRGEPPPMDDVGAVDFLHDPVGRKGRAPGVGHALLGLMDSAVSSITIESPYLVPSRAFRGGLDRALERGVHVRILTNSLATTDNLWPQAGYVGQKKKLVRKGVELWEYTGPECLHSKAALIDDRVAIVGSFNLDPRSEHLNTELAIVLRDAEQAGTLLQMMDAHLEHAVRIDRNGRPEGADRRYPGVSRSKVCKLRLLRLFTPFVKRQL